MSWEKVDNVVLDSPGGINPETGRLSVNITARRSPDDIQFDDDLAADAPEGWAQFAGELDVLPEEAAQPSFADEASRAAQLAGRSLMNAAGGTADLVTLPITTIMNLLGANIRPYRDITNEAASSLGFAEPETTGEKIGSAIGEYGAAGLGVSGLARGAAGALSGLAGQVAGTLGRTPALDAIGAAGGGVGQTIAEESGAGPIGQVAGALGGGLTAGGLAVGAPSTYRRVFQSTEPSELLAAFHRQMVQPMADQVGGSTARLASAGSRATLGGIPLAQAAEKSIETARAARDRIAGIIGDVAADETSAGQAIRRGFDKTIKSTQERAAALYNSIPIESSRPAVLNSTKEKLAELNMGLQSNEALSQMLSDPRLRGYQMALEGRTNQVPIGILDADGNAITRPVQEGGQLSWDDLKRFRTYVGEKAGSPSFQNDTSKDALRGLYGALSDDMRATAMAEGPEAAKAFERANSYYRARQARIDDVISPILGDDMSKSAESALRQINNWAASKGRGDFARLSQALRSLPADEANTVRATIFSKLGEVPKGRQSGAGDVFSPSDFATHWNNISPRAKSILFPDKKYQQDLRDIATIADAMKRSGEFANTSRTALAGNSIGLVTMGLMGSPIAAGGIAGSQLGVGKLLASPRFARWLASAPKKPNGPSTLAHINRLTAIGAAEPTIANEVLLLQERLASAFTRTPYRAAASPGDVTTEQEIDY